jgi:hypothetical protein
LPGISIGPIYKNLKELRFENGDVIPDVESYFV